MRHCEEQECRGNHTSVESDNEDEEVGQSTHISRQQIYDTAFDKHNDENKEITITVIIMT